MVQEGHVAHSFEEYMDDRNNTCGVAWPATVVVTTCHPVHVECRVYREPAQIQNNPGSNPGINFAKFFFAPISLHGSHEKCQKVQQITCNYINFIFDSKS